MTISKQLELGIFIPPSREEVLESLRERSGLLHETYLEERVNPRLWGYEIRRTELDLGVVAMAIDGVQEESQAPRNPLLRARWLDVARNDMLAFISEDPVKRQFLKDSVYLSTDRETEQKLGRIVSAAVTPAGIYDELEFAVGVANGLVVAKPYALPPLK